MENLKFPIMKYVYLLIFVLFQLVTVLTIFYLLKF